MIKELKLKADEFDSVDSKLQVWNEINGMVNSNVAPFLEVADRNELKDLLSQISDDAGKVNKSVIEEDIKALQAAIGETIKRIDSAIA